ncbi:SEC-C metal-binding domain-containing protein [Streptomyces collinus]
MIENRLYIEFIASRSEPCPCGSGTTAIRVTRSPRCARLHPVPIHR